MFAKCVVESLCLDLFLISEITTEWKNVENPDDENIQNDRQQREEPKIASVQAWKKTPAICCFMRL